MNRISLLDCTLRDGGYLNDWKFGRENIVSIFERLVASDVEYIEVGFIDQERLYDPDRTIFPDVKSINNTFMSLDHKKSQIVGMIDYGHVDISLVCPKEESCLDAIRVIFKKGIRHEAMNYCKQLKALGYKVFAQLVSITSYSDEELLDLIKLANEIEPFAVSMVDTYGLCHSDTLMHYCEILDKNLSSSIELGYHAHNNFQLGYANCIEMLSYKTNRKVLVDGTIYGMGKSAGNCPIELIAMYLNERHNKEYDISQILEAADSNVMSFQKESPWGYNLFFYIAASNDCHPNYVSYLINKRTLSIKQINKILSKLQGEKKLLYDEKLIENLYSDFQEQEVNDDAAISELKADLCGKEILILGPGTSVEKESDKVLKFVEDRNPIIISINHMPGKVKINYCFLTNAKRFVQLSSAIHKKEYDFKVIATSNVTKSVNEFDYTIRYSNLLDFNAQIIDNSFLMLLKLLKKIGINGVSCAGFDGYAPDNKPNYFNPDMEYNFTSFEAAALNDYVITELNKLAYDFKIDFITNTYYNI